MAGFTTMDIDCSLPAFSNASASAVLPLESKMRQVYHVSYRLVFQMGRDGRKKKSDTKSGSSHAGQQIGTFTAEQMARCLAEIQHYKQRQQQLGLAKMEKSMNQIARNHGLSPVMVNKRATGKVIGMGSQLGGPRRGSAYTAGKFQAIHCMVIGLQAAVEDLCVQHIDLLHPQFVSLC